MRMVEAFPNHGLILVHIGGLTLNLTREEASLLVAQINSALTNDSRKRNEEWRATVATCVKPHD